jgi:hypothetical protein
MALTDNDLEKLAVLLRDRPAVSCQDSCIYKKTVMHDKAHEILDRWIENDIARKARYEKIKATVIGGLVISAAGAVGTGALTAVNYLKDHLK